MSEPPISHASAMREYLAAVWKDGIAAMGASLGVFAAFGAVYFAFIAQHNIAVLWLLALLGFVVAGYRVWLKEHAKAASVETGPQLTGFFQDVAMEPYPYEDDGQGGQVVKNRLGTEIKVIVRIVNTSPTPTTIHDFNLELKIDDTLYLAKHAEDDEKHMWFERKNGVVHHHVEPVSERCLIQYLAKRKIEIGQPLEGIIRFRIPGLFADGFPNEQHTVELALGVEDERSKRHFIVDTWGPPPRPARELEHGIQKGLRERYKR